MKRLTLIRHGAADAPLGRQKDFERTLNDQGLLEANAVGQLLRKHSFKFDQMYCSAAQRALTTAQIIYGTLAPNSQPLLAEQALYNSDLEPLYRFIEMLENDIEHAVIVAHNPGLSYLASDLLREPINGMSTCTVVQLQLNIDEWVAVQPHCGQLLAIDTPPLTTDTPV